MVREIASVLRSTFVRAHFVLEDMGAQSMTIVKCTQNSACRNFRQAVSAARINEASNADCITTHSDLDSRSINHTSNVNQANAQSVNFRL